MTKHTNNVKPVDPATEAAILDLFATRWTLPEQAQQSEVEPYRGPPRPAEADGRKGYTPPAKRSVTIEEIAQYHAKAKSIEQGLRSILKTCKQHGVTEIEVRNRKPMGGLHRAHDFTLEARNVIVEMAGEK